MKVARGRSWQPEIGMEHASRGRRSGNKGVGARWRGRFRIFSARHCSRTKVSHAENSGMTMLFFSLEVAPMSEGDSFTGSGAAARGVRGIGGFFCGWTGNRCGSGRLTTGVVRHACRLRRDGTRRFLVWGILSHAQERLHEGGVFGGIICGFVADAVAVCFEGCCGSMCWPRERPATHAAAGAAARGF